jgi:hypothetical protein
VLLLLVGLLLAFALVASLTVVLLRCTLVLVGLVDVVLLFQLLGAGAGNRPDAGHRVCHGGVIGALAVGI